MAEGQFGPGPEAQRQIQPPDNLQHQENIGREPLKLTDSNLEFLTGSFDGLKWRELPSSRSDMVEEYIRAQRAYIRLSGTEALYTPEKWQEIWPSMEEDIREEREDTDAYPDERLRRGIESTRRHIDNLLTGKTQPRSRNIRITTDPDSLASP